MKVISNFILNNRWFLFGLLLTAALLWPLFYAPFFNMQDDEQLIRLYEMKVCLIDFQIPCRWVPDLGAGMGYPLFNFYAPLAYYIGAIIYLITNNLLFSAKSMYGIAFIGAYIFMYLAGRKLWGNTGGFLSAVLYIFVPYHALNFYVRGAMGEMWGMMFFPAIFWAILRLKERQSLLNCALLALTFGLLIISHNLSALLFFPVLIALFLIQLKFVTAGKKYLLLGSSGIILGLLLSAFYWLPAMVEKDLTWVETTTVGYFSYSEHFKGLRKLFLDNSWKYGNSIREVPGGEKDGMSYQIGTVHLLVMILAVIGIYLNRNKQKFQIFIAALLLLVILAGIFMIHPRSQFIWDLLKPQIRYVQFPWRFLLLISFSVSLLGGGVVGLWQKIAPKYLVLGSLILVWGIVAFNTGFFMPDKYLYHTEQQWLSGDLWKLQQRKAILDYLPRSAAEAPAAVIDKDYDILTGKARVSNFKSGSNWFSLEADVYSHTILRIYNYDFPTWRVTVDGNPAEIDVKNNLGLITLLLGEGNHQIEGKLTDSPVRQLGNLLTVIGLILLFSLEILGISKTRKWLLYYLKGFK